MTPICWHFPLILTTGILPVSRALATLSIYIHAEPNAAIIAASIPVLRTLLRDVKNFYSNSRTGATGKYIRSNPHSKFHEGVVSVTGASGTNGDNDSENGILAGDKAHQGIRRTEHVVVEYEVHGNNHAYEDGIELERRRQRH